MDNQINIPRKDKHINYLELMKEYSESGEYACDFCERHGLQQNKVSIASHIYDYFYRSHLLREHINAKIRFFLYIYLLMDRKRSATPAEFGLVYRIPMPEFYMAARIFKDFPIVKEHASKFVFTKEQFLKELAAFHYAMDLKLLETKVAYLWE